MISRLSGQVLEAGANWLVVRTGGIGLHAWCTPATAAGAHPGHDIEVFTTLVVREDALTLYGFATSQERDTFELAMSASGVGPKLALALVSVLSPAEFVAAVQGEDAKRLTKVPGIGAKGAQKMVIELKDKVAALGIDQSSTGRPGPSTASAGGWRDQVVAGLEGLGWSNRDAEAAAGRVESLAAQEPVPSVSELMRAALKSLAR